MQKQSDGASLDNMSHTNQQLPFRSVAIIGVGLIGGSLALALRQRFPSIHITGFDKATVLRRALERGAIHKASPSLKEAVVDADLVVLATPVKTIIDLLPTIAQYASYSSVITDTGSVKSPIIKLAKKLFPSGNFVGGHPMTGAEFSGINAAHPLLFQNALYLLSPTHSNKQKAYKQLVTLFTALDARVLRIDAAVHDNVVAAVSHLPQLAAVALMNTVGHDHSVSKNYLNLAAGGFRDMTRIASSPFDMWNDILELNVTAVHNALQLYINNLESIAKRLKKDTTLLKNDFSRSRTLRNRIPRSMKGFLTALVDISVYVDDKPGQLAKLTTALSKAGINIKDMELLKIREGRGGTFRLSFENDTTAQQAKAILNENGFEICD